jgi:hypothetical protein
MLHKFFGAALEAEVFFVVILNPLKCPYYDTWTLDKPGEKRAGKW